MRLVVQDTAVVGEARLVEVLGKAGRLVCLAVDETGELVEGDSLLFGEQAQQLELPALGLAQSGTAAGAGGAAATALRADRPAGDAHVGPHPQASPSR